MGNLIKISNARPTSQFWRGREKLLPPCFQWSIRKICLMFFGNSIQRQVLGQAWRKLLISRVSKSLSKQKPSLQLKKSKNESMRDIGEVLRMKKEVLGYFAWFGDDFRFLPLKTSSTPSRARAGRDSLFPYPLDPCTTQLVVSNVP